MGKINFLYEKKEGEYLIWNLEDWKLKNKKYFFWRLIDLDFADEMNIYLLDTKFNYYLKSFVSIDKKITLQDIEANLKDFDLWKDRFIWYTITDIVIDWQKSDILLWKTWEITYNIWVYTLDNINYNSVLRDFGKNMKLNIFPSSFWTVKYLWKEVLNWNLLYLWENKIEIIVINSWFYKYIDVLDIWLLQFKNTILEIFWKQIITLEWFSFFHKKIYFKSMDTFLEPIVMFLKDNLINDKIFVIWDFMYFPDILQVLWNKLKANIIPVRIWNKDFKTVEKINIYTILRNNK